MKLEDFPKLYYKHTNEELAKMFNVKSTNTIVAYARRIGLSPKGRGYMHENDKRKLSKLEKEN